MRTNDSELSKLRFGAFELDMKSKELRSRNGSIIKLQQQPVKVLIMLASRPHQLVTREEIQQHLWGEDTFVDFEQGVNHCIKQIRIALGDDAQSPRYIETLPRRGYRFIAPVDALNGTLPQQNEIVATSLKNTHSEKPLKTETTELANPTEPRAERKNFRLIAFSIAFVLATVSIAGYLIWRQSKGQPSPTRKKVMIAVLPFENLSAIPESDYFSDGLTAEMITQLGRLQPQHLGVIARASVMRYKESKKHISSIGNELNVDYVLEGNVRREGNRMRVTAQLIQVNDQTHLWAETYDRNDSDTLSLQTEIANRIAHSLSSELLASENFSPYKTSNNPGAYDAYLKGRYLSNKANYDDVKKSVEYFQEAIQKDPEFALAQAALADTYYQLGYTGVIPPKEAYAKAKVSALKALELDDSNAEAYTVLGSVQFHLEWNWTEAEKSFTKAIYLNPSSAMAHHDYAWYLVALERFDEAIAEITHAQALDPLSLRVNSDAGWIHLRARRYDDAIEKIRRTLELEPNYLAAYQCLECAYFQKGMYEESLHEARKIMKRFGVDEEEIASVTQGEQSTAVRRVEPWRLKKLSDAATKGSINPYTFALQYAALGEKEKALEWLERAYKERDVAIITLKVDQVWDNMRDEQPYKNIVSLINFPKPIQKE